MQAAGSLALHAARRGIAVSFESHGVADQHVAVEGSRSAALLDALCSVEADGSASLAAQLARPPAGRLCIVTSDLGPPWSNVCARCGRAGAGSRWSRSTRRPSAAPDAFAATRRGARARRDRGRGRARDDDLARTLAPLVATGCPVRPDPASRPGPLVRALIFAGLALLGVWHLSRLQSPSLAPRDVLVPALLALAVAVARGRRPPSVRARARRVARRHRGGRGPGMALGRTPARSVRTDLHRLHEGGGRFATVVLPFDPVAEPGLHALLLAGTAVWLLALALVWLVAARPLPTAVVGVLPLALVSTEFPLPRPGLRVALLVGLVVWTLGSGRRGGARPLAAMAAPLVLIALVGAELPGLARASFLDWHAWGRASRRLELRGAATSASPGTSRTTACTTPASRSSSSVCARRIPPTGG